MHRLIGSALVFVCASACAQGVTKWIDEKGRVHYGERPPPGAKEQAIKGGTTSTVGGQAKPVSKSAPAPAGMAATPPGTTLPDPTRRDNIAKQPQQRQGERRPEPDGEAAKDRNPAEEQKQR